MFAAGRGDLVGQQGGVVDPALGDVDVPADDVPQHLRQIPVTEFGRGSAPIQFGDDLQRGVLADPDFRHLVDETAERLVGGEEAGFDHVSNLPQDHERITGKAAHDGRVRSIRPFPPDTAPRKGPEVKPQSQSSRSGDDATKARHMARATTNTKRPHRQKVTNPAGTRAEPPKPTRSLAC
ncbi:hypothetical protein [Lentzea aerocolonigenes]|uniref:hypothetical protein n=1 Tax=Lentzea aerocolonigenes TaxID=68170 RepID=UPI0012DD0767|nr:hypothetical protein [Lentzea aerocolonigenes]